MFVFVLGRVGLIYTLTVKLTKCSEHRVFQKQALSLCVKRGFQKQAHLLCVCVFVFVLGRVWLTDTLTVKRTKCIKHCMSQRWALSLCVKGSFQKQAHSLCVCVCACFGESVVVKLTQCSKHCMFQRWVLSLYVCVCVSFGGTGVDRRFISDANKMQQALRVSETSTFTLCVCVCVCVCVLGRVGLTDTLKVKLKKCSEHCMF